MRGQKLLFAWADIDEMGLEAMMFQKEENFWEENNSRLMIVILLAFLVIGLIYVIFQWRERRMEIDIRSKISREKQHEIELAAYRDLVTGVYNRNFYELDKEHYPVEKIKALAVIGINNAEYLRKRKGTIYVEDLLREVVKILRENAGESERIYRISDYIFCIPFRNDIGLEEFTQNIKSTFVLYFEENGEEPTGLSVGAVYNDLYMKDTYKSLFDRCDRMRRMDQKHEEDRFIRSKIAEVERSIVEESIAEDQ